MKQGTKHREWCIGGCGVPCNCGVSHNYRKEVNMYPNSYANPKVSEKYNEAATQSYQQSPRQGAVPGALEVQSSVATALFQAVKVLEDRLTPILQARFEEFEKKDKEGTAPIATGCGLAAAINDNTEIIRAVQSCITNISSRCEL